MYMHQEYTAHYNGLCMHANDLRREEVSCLWHKQNIERQLQRRNHRAVAAHQKMQRRLASMLEQEQKMMVCILTLLSMNFIHNA